MFHLVATFVAFLVWIENTPLAIWVGESQWGFPVSLTLHAVGMGFLAGLQFALGLRLLGAARTVPAMLLLRFYPLLWACAGLSLVSGVMLLSAYPAKALTNPVFFLKLLLIATGLWLAAKPVRSQLLSMTADTTPTSRQRMLGMTLMALWMLTITAGRLLAYTHSVMRANELAGG
jgi:hypothetical protein